jgi:pimeloyl-ACP methyl ester carboxylesterase
VGVRNNATIETHFRTIDGLSIRFAESESRGDDALLLCPWPESLFAFDQMWERLAEEAHLVAIDLPGFGHSERGDSLLSPSTMGEFVVRAADAFGLEEPHVVGPDIGTGALLFVAALQPGRWCSLVVGVGRRRTLSSWVVRLPNGSGRRTSKSSRSLTRANSWQARAYPGELALLRDLLPKVETPVQIIAGGMTPVQIIAGAHDPAVPPVNAEYLRERLPRSKLDIVDAGHFTWEDAAGDYAALVTTWWATGHSTLARKEPHDHD